MTRNWEMEIQPLTKSLLVLHCFPAHPRRAAAIVVCDRLLAQTLVEQRLTIFKHIYLIIIHCDHVIE